MFNKGMKSACSSGAVWLWFRVPVVIGWLVLSIAFAPRNLAAQVSVTVPGTANIFGAGHSIPPDPGGGGGGTLPVQVSIPTGAWYVTFPSVSGAISTLSLSGVTNGPDAAVGGSYDISSYGGISGIVDTNRGGFLAGVFVGPSEPLDPAPARLTFSDATIGFESLAPALCQGFFIGDGLTGTGTGDLQKFYVPTGASRLYLGIYDSYGWTGLPGYYDDNGGQFDVTVAPSVVHQLSIRVSQVELCWDTVTNEIYQLQYRSTLTTNNWLPLGGTVVGNGSRFCTNDAVLLGQAQRFYQLVVTNSP